MDPTVRFPSSRPFFWAFERPIPDDSKLTHLSFLLYSPSRVWYCTISLISYTFGYRHALAKRIPPLDSPRQEHSFESLNVPFRTTSSSLTSLFYCTIVAKYSTARLISYIFGYRHAIAKWIPPLDSPRREHSFEPSNVPFRTISSSLTSLFYWTIVAD